MLRASNGAISSGETFWLMAAMRKNERIGPGMAIVEVGGWGDGFAGPGAEAAVGAAASWARTSDQAQEPSESAATTGRQRRDLMTVPQNVQISRHTIRLRGLSRQAAGFRGLRPEIGRAH